MTVATVQNFVGGEWVDSASTERLDVVNPATAEPIAQVPLSTREEVDRAVRVAQEAFQGWRETPPTARIRYFFRLKELMEANFEELARTLVMEEGKTIDESRGEIRRAIENVEVTTGIPSLMMGYNLEDIAPEIDEECIRQPLGVFCVIPPFNFPTMVPMWFLPYAVACGNTFIIKPSEQVPLSMNKLVHLMDEAGFPPGTVNLVNGARGVAEALMEHPLVKGVSFVGSTAVAKQIYAKAAAHGKRVQCQGGAKNFMVVMPDAVLERTVPALITSVYGCAGERCLSGSVLLAVGEAYEPLRDAFTEAASRLKVGYGLDESSQMGPVVSRRHKERVLSYINKGVEEGARLLLDGRHVEVKDYPGFFVGPTVFDRVNPEMTIARDEIFGPVGSIMRVRDLDEAVEIIHASPYGNAAAVFTSSGQVARRFQYRVQCGNIGINIGIVAPMAFFPFGGFKDSFFGDLHGQGRDAVNFFTERKIVISRWF
ncbi:MAG: CoA-acylating methylmalonate-semialdehyde dehydrogenase [Chloroflexi bacterium]|nr:CoA-acylating methylmalonate-semialdehyde dehydrogenase [Chloroflexota bacterium]